jgi:hypothetical protein
MSRKKGDGGLGLGLSRERKRERREIAMNYFRKRQTKHIAPKEQ